MNQPNLQLNSSVKDFFDQAMKYRQGASCISIDIAQLLTIYDPSIVEECALVYFGKGVEIKGTTLFRPPVYELVATGGNLEQHYFNETGDFL